MTDQPVLTAPRPKGRIGREVEDAPCACTTDRMCLLHYGKLDPGRQTRERRQAGVHEPYLGPGGSRYGR
jgi:hypothetical protein